jgi:glyoxylase-like metal-dependent hydrolase (beta-lactamase superfamily II)
MRRSTQKFFSAATLIAGFLLALANCAAADSGSNPAIAGYAPVSVEMQAVKVSPHVYFVQGKAGAATDNKGFISNAGFVVTSKGVVVFDALGTPSLAVELYKKIREVTSQPVKIVVMSHYHADHVYGLQVFKDMGAEIYAPAGAIDYLSSATSDNLLAQRRKDLKPWIDARTHLVPADHYLKDDTEFSLGDMTFKLSLLGSAHSEGDMAMLVEPDQVLFTGDIIFEGRIPFIGESNTRNWLLQLEKLKSAKVSALIPGHGPMARNPNKLIASTHRYLSYLREQMGQAVKNWIGFDQAYDQVDWSEFEFQPAFMEANRRNAYNVYLAMEKESFD